MFGCVWRRRTAKMALVAFGASCMACGDSPTDTPVPSTTSTAVSTTLAPPSTASLTEGPEPLSEGELRKLVAPVALYPDVVLASLLPATTYPEQLHDAALWVDERDDSIDAVPEDRNWDGSVAGLLQFPDVLRWADQNEPWTEEMGSAMTYQQGPVLRAIQDYRGDVAEAGNLESNAFHTVVRDDDDIQIQPTQPDTVYVPQYDPVAATQPQVERQGVNPWIAFGGGVLVGALGAWALYSIFDDDDDDDDDHVHRRRRVKRANSYYYAGRQRRPPAEVWTPRPRRAARRARRAEAFDPEPFQAVGTARRGKPGKGPGGVRPPTSRPATEEFRAKSVETPRTKAGPKKKAGQKKTGSKKAGPKKAGPKKAGPKQAGPKKAGPKKAGDGQQGKSQQGAGSR